MNTKGLLLPIFSLPGKFGIGEFGKEAFSFIRLLKDNGFNTWQILPLNPISFGHSPYQPFSSYAIEELYLSLDDLHEKGLIKKPKSFRVGKPHINYEQVRSFKEPYYQEAFENYLLLNGNQKIKEFAIANPHIDKYASFMANKRLNDNKCWNDWDKLEAFGFQKLKDYYLLLQMLLLEQWNKIHIYAKENGISIIGDLPFYVGYDSSDVYYNQKYFLLGENKLPLFVAGVSPDYFSKLGQRWGNPIYNFDELKKNDYSFLVNRIGYASYLYDRIRLDHFRAFDTYYVIDAKYEDARIGKWLEAPGYEIFDLLFAKYPNIDIIAEDLGDLRPEVYRLKEHYKLPGMNVLEFNLDNIIQMGKLEGKLLPNEITYIGTHDNMTLSGFIISLKMSQKSAYKRYFVSLGINARSLEDMILIYAFKYFENVIISFSDFMHLNNHARINTPSSLNESNWTIRLKDFKLLKYYLKKGIQNV